MHALRLAVAVAAMAVTPLVVVAEEPGQGKTSKQKVGEQSLFGINWQSNLDAAKKVARKTQPGKPIVLLRVLGELDDKL